MSITNNTLMSITDITQCHYAARKVFLDMLLDCICNARNLVCGAEQGVP